jgi:hypothetical protein
MGAEGAEVTEAVDRFDAPAAGLAKSGLESQVVAVETTEQRDAGEGPLSLWERVRVRV